MEIISKQKPLCRKGLKIVILNGTKWSEESLARMGLRFFAALRMTSIFF